MHGELASFWTTADEQGETPRQKLLALRKALMLAEVELRLGDQTLANGPAEQMRACLEQPLPSQRRQLPLASRPQVYRVLLEGIRPNWRSYLPGTLIIVAGTAEGPMLTPEDAAGMALLCSLSQGIEAFESLAALHQELCERLEDPLQSKPLLHLYTDAQADRVRLSQRLRYDWYADSLLEAQIDSVIEAQRQRLSDTGLWSSSPHQHTRIHKAMELWHEVGAKPILQTRYSRLLEKNLPNWLRNTSAQGLSHMMQAMQELVAIAEQAAAPGVLSFNDFKQRNSLLGWANARLRERLRMTWGTLQIPAISRSWSCVPAALAPSCIPSPSHPMSPMQACDAWATRWSKWSRKSIPSKRSPSRTCRGSIPTTGLLPE